MTIFRNIVGFENVISDKLPDPDRHYDVLRMKIYM